MRLAIIDLGTNSVRFDVHEIHRPPRGASQGKKKASKAGTSQRLYREKIMVRLGQSAFLQGKLDPQAVQRTLSALKSFRAIATALQVDRILAFGTSALREVQDRALFLKKAKAILKTPLRVISGKEEARLIAVGILAFEKLPTKPFALVDIGGGSTEISICRGKKILHTHSFPVGVARLQQLFLKKSPPSAKAIEALRTFTRQAFEQEGVDQNWPRVNLIIGSSGTIRTLQRLLKTKKTTAVFEKTDLKKLIAKMSRMTASQLEKLDGMDPRRVDMILAGALLFEECLSVLGAKRARGTPYALRDGILEDYRRRRG